MRKLDLGCGNDKAEGCIGIDKYRYSCVDVVRDIDIHGLPFDSDSIDEVRAFHFLEHCRDLIFVMNEIWRVLKSGARCIIRVPCIEVGTGAFRDPTHVRYFNKDSFEYFTGSTWVYDSLDIRPFKLVIKHLNGESLEVILEK